MKAKSRTEIIDDIALEAMKCILGNVYQSPQMLTMMVDVGAANNQSAAEEIAERAYLQAEAMLKKKAQRNS